jgi:outer membrane protein assembly factor BamD (BamD/ComL family)
MKASSVPGLNIYLRLRPGKFISLGGVFVKGFNKSMLFPMTFQKRSAFLFICFFLFLQLGFASDKGLKALSEKKYDQAYAIFTADLEKNPDDVVALYGLTKLLSLQEFPQYNLEKAYVHLINAKEAYKVLDEKKKKRLVKTEVQEANLLALQEAIDAAAFREAVRANTVEALDGFLKVHRTSPQLDEALALRKQLEYLEVKKANTYQAYAEYLKKYPDSDKVVEAKKKYEQLLYQTLTADGSFQSYKNFIEQYPKSPYLKEATEKMNLQELKSLLKENSLEGYEAFLASNPDSKFRRRVEDSIYARFTSFPSIAEYENFISRYPKNYNYRDAWEKLYVLFNDSGTPETYEAFKARYPQYPEAHQLENDIELSNFGQKMLNTNFEGFKEDQIDAYITLAAPTEQAITVLKIRIKPLLEAHQYQKAIDLLEKYKPYYHYKAYRISSWIETLRQVKDTFQTKKTVPAYTLN